MQRGKLNIFQQTMLKWDEFYPYNAVVVVRLPVAAGIFAVRTSIEEAIETLGIGRISIGRNKNRFEYIPGRYEIDLTVIDGSHAATDIVRHEVERQLNTRFLETEGILNPFRFFIVQGADESHIGIAWFHMVADGLSIIRILLDAVGNRYIGMPAIPTGDRVEIYPRTFFSSILRRSPLLFKSIFRPPAFLWKMRKACKPKKMYNYNAIEVGFRHYQLEPSTTTAIKDASSAWGVTTNDLLLSALLKAIAPFARSRSIRNGKRGITIGFPVDISKDIGCRSKRTFGVLLSIFTVQHIAPDSLSLKQLAEDIRKQTEKLKKSRRYIGSFLEQWIGLKLLPLHSRIEQLKFYPKHYPLWAGLTNINLKRTFEKPYFRGATITFGVSTGPNCPLLLSVIQQKDFITIGVNYRTELFTPDDIAQLMESFKGYLNLPFSESV